MQGGKETADTRGLRWRVVILCALVCLLDGFDNVVAPIAAPVMAGQWNLSPEAFSFALSAAILGSGLGAAFLSPLGDRFGRRPLVLASFGLVGLTTLTVAVSANVQQLAILRLMTGLGLGASFASALALTSEFAPPEYRSRIVSSVYAMSAVGGALGGLVAPLLIEGGGWQRLYLFGGAIPLVLLIALMIGLPESREFRDLRAERIASGEPGKAIGVLARLGALFAAEYRAATILVWLLYFFSMFANYMILAWLPTLMTLAGWSLAEASFAVTAYALGGVIGGFAMGWLVDHARTRLALLIGFAGTAAALGALAFVPAVAWIWMALILATGFGVVGITYALAAVAAAIYPTSLRASGIGAGAAVGRVGAALAPVFGGMLLAAGFSAIGIMSSLIAPMLVAVIIVLVFSARLDVAQATGAPPGGEGDDGA